MIEVARTAAMGEDWRSGDPRGGLKAEGNAATVASLLSLEPAPGSRVGMAPYCGRVECGEDMRAGGGENFHTQHTHTQAN